MAFHLTSQRQVLVALIRDAYEHGQLDELESDLTDSLDIVREHGRRAFLRREARIKSTIAAWERTASVQDGEFTVVDTTPAWPDETFGYQTGVDEQFHHCDECGEPQPDANVHVDSTHAPACSLYDADVYRGPFDPDTHTACPICGPHYIDCEHEGAK